MVVGAQWRAAAATLCWYFGLLPSLCFRIHVCFCFVLTIEQGVKLRFLIGCFMGARRFVLPISYCLYRSTTSSDNVCVCCGVYV